MNNSVFRLIVLCLALVIVIGGAALLYRNLEGRVDLADLNQTEATEITGESTEATKSDDLLVPDITLTDLEGNEVSLYDFRGKPVVMNFWATWCGPCKSELPEFQTQYEKFGSDVHFLMVNLGENFSDLWGDAVSLIQDGGYTFPVYFDDEAEAAASFGITSIPVTVFIDAEGYLVNGQIGAMDGETLEDAIEALLAK